jgi:hypothetical protein
MHGHVIAHVVLAAADAEQFGDALDGVGDDGELFEVQTDQAVAVFEFQGSGVAGHLAAEVAEAVGESVVEGLGVELFFEALDEPLGDGDV